MLTFKKKLIKNINYIQLYIPGPVLLYRFIGEWEKLSVSEQENAINKSIISQEAIVRYAAGLYLLLLLLLLMFIFSLHYHKKY